MNRSANTSRRVVITGLGLISPLGNTRQAMWTALSEGRSGVVSIGNLYPPMAGSYRGLAREFTGDIEGFGPLEGEKKKSIRKGLKVMCRESQMGVAAAQRAIHDAGLANGGHEPDRTGVVFGSDYMLSDPDEFTSAIQACRPGGQDFEFGEWAGTGLSKMPPLWLLKYLPNMPASHIAIYNDMRGHSNSITLREAAALLAVGEAFRVIQRDRADIMVAGATGTRTQAMKALHAIQLEPAADPSLVPEEACRPFDRDRTGQVLGEGAGSVILEELASARARGVPIYAEVIGFGSSSVTGRRTMARRDLALANAMRAALRDAGLEPGDVGHIQAHGLATPSCDEDEARALQMVFGELATHLPVTAPKSYFGNLGAGSGLVELIAGVMALGTGRLFPILNYRTPDPACPICAVTSADVPTGSTFLKLSVTPQGQASCIVVRSFA